MFSKDGFIIFQSLTSKIPYGKFFSDKKGCGWIASFNFLKFDDDNLTYEDTYKTFNKRLDFAGALGTNPFRVRKFLKKYNPELKVRLFNKKFLNRNVKKGIILYCVGLGFHYVAFNNVRDNEYRILNICDSCPDYTCSFEKFYNHFMKYKIAFIFYI